MAGDSLAAGAKSAQFRTGGGTLSEIAYDLRVLTKAEFEAKHPEQNYERLMADMSKIKRASHERFTQDVTMKHGDLKVSAE